MNSESGSIDPEKNKSKTQEGVGTDQLLEAAKQSELRRAEPDNVRNRAKSEGVDDLLESIKKVEARRMVERGVGAEIPSELIEVSTGRISDIEKETSDVVKGGIGVLDAGVKSLDGTDVEVNEGKEKLSEIQEQIVSASTDAKDEIIQVVTGDVGESLPPPKPEVSPPIAGDTAKPPETPPEQAPIENAPLPIQEPEGEGKEKPFVAPENPSQDEQEKAEAYINKLSPQGNSVQSPEPTPKSEEQIVEDYIKKATNESDQAPFEARDFGNPNEAAPVPTPKKPKEVEEDLVEVELIEEPAPLDVVPLSPEEELEHAHEMDVKTYLKDDYSQYKKLLEARKRYERLLDALENPTPITTQEGETEGETLERKKEGRLSKKAIKNYKNQIDDIDWKMEQCERRARWAKEDYIGSKKFYNDKIDNIQYDEDRNDKIENLKNLVKIARKAGNKAEADRLQGQADRLESQIDRLEKKKNGLWKNPLNWPVIKQVSKGAKWLARRSRILGIASIVGIPHSVKEIIARQKSGDRSQVLPAWFNKLAIKLSGALFGEEEQKHYFKGNGETVKKNEDDKKENENKAPEQIDLLNGVEHGDVGSNGNLKPEIVEDPKIDALRKKEEAGTISKEELDELQNSEIVQFSEDVKPFGEESFDSKKKFEELKKMLAKKVAGKPDEASIEAAKSVRENANILRENIVKQQEAWALCQSFIERQIRINPNVPSDKANEWKSNLMGWVEKFGVQYGFTSEQKKEAEEIIDRYKIQQERAVIIQEKYKDKNKDLISLLTDGKTTEELGITEEDIKNVKVSFDKIIVVIEANRKITDILLTKDSRSINSKFPSVGFYRMSGGVMYAIINQESKNQEGTKKHEIQHAINDLYGKMFRKLEVTAEEEEYEKQSSEQNLEKLLRAYQKYALGEVKDEFMASLRDSEGLEGLKGLKKKLRGEKKERWERMFLDQDPENPYNFRNEIKEKKINGSRVYEINLDLSKKIFEKEYEGKIGDAIDAFSDLVSEKQKEGFTEEEALGESMRLLNFIDLDSWRSTVRRLTKEQEIRKDKLLEDKLKYLGFLNGNIPSDYKGSDPFTLGNISSREKTVKEIIDYVKGEIGKAKTFRGLYKILDLTFGQMEIIDGNKGRFDVKRIKDSIEKIRNKEGFRFLRTKKKNIERLIAESDMDDGYNLKEKVRDLLYEEFGLKK